MPASSDKIKSGSPSGSSFADLADSIIQAIEAGFQGAMNQAQTGSAAAPVVGAGSAAAVSSVVEPSGGIGGAGHGGPSPSDHDAGAGEHGQASSGHGNNGSTEHGSGEEGKPEHEGEAGEKGRVKNLGEYVDRLKSGFWEEEAGIGYPSLELATGLSKRVEKLDSGQFVSAEEKQHSLSEAILPGAGGIIGAAVGTAFGNPLLGSFVGQGIGEIGAAVIGAKSEKDETTREAAEKLSAALGLAESSVHTFRQAIEATGAPVAQVSQGLSLLENTGIVGGSKAIAGQGQLALGLGEQFTPVESLLTQTISQNPALFQVADQFTQNGTLNGQDFRSLAQYELLQGNLPAYTAAQQAGAATRYSANPKISQLQQDKSFIESSPFNRAGNWVGGLLSGHNIEDEDTAEIDKLKEEDDKRRKEANKGTQTEQEDDRRNLLERGQARFDTIQATSDASNLIERYRYNALGDTSPQQLAKQLPGIKAALQRNADADEVMINQDKRQMEAAGPDSPLRPAYELEISQLKDDQIQKRDIKYRELVTENYKDQISTTSAESSLAQARTLIEGGSAAEIQQQVNAQARYLTGMATAPGNPLSPQETASIQEAAIKQQYSAKLNVYTERLDENSLSADTAGLNVSRTRLGGGSPDQVLEAQQGVLSTYTDRIKELSSEIERGGLTVADRITKERELTSVQTAALSLSVESVRERNAATSSIASSNLERDESGLSRTIERTGNAGAGSGAYADSYAQIAAIDRQYADEKDPVKKAALGTQAAKAREDAEALLDQTNTYSPGGAFSRKMATDRTDLQISLDNPYQDGDPNADPVTRSRGALADLSQDLGGLRRNRATLIAQGKWRDEDETRFTEQSNSDRLQISQVEKQERTAYESMLPEMLAGTPGQGRLTGILPTSGQSAFYNSNPFVNGSFGKPNTHLTNDGEGHTPQAGGQAGAFLAATGGAAARALMGDTGPAILAELRRLNANVERSSSSTRSPVMTSGSTGGVRPYEYNGGGR